MNRKEKFGNQAYNCFGQQPIEEKISGSIMVHLFERVKFTEDTTPLPLFSILPLETQKDMRDRLENLDKLRGIGHEEAKPEPESEEEKDSCLSNPPSKCERVIGHILCFFCFGGCGVLSFTAFNGAFDFHVAALILPSLVIL
jgi:hypothetical protein